MSDVVGKHNITKDEVIDLLKGHGITPTQQRIDIGAILFARPQHLSADQVLEMANSAGAHVSKATVYNTLGLFASKKLVREVIVDPSKVFYDSNISQHHHFYNVDTHCLTDIDHHWVAIEGLPAVPEDTEVDGIEVIVRLKNKA